MIIEIEKYKLKSIIKKEMNDCVLEFDKGKLDVKWFDSIADCMSANIATYQVKYDHRNTFIKRWLAIIVEYIF